MSTYIEYGIFIKTRLPASDNPEKVYYMAKPVVTFTRLPEVGQWLASVSEDSRDGYAVRQRTVTITPWTGLHSGPRRRG